MSKVCRSCQVDLPLSNFTGKYATCKNCRNKKQREAYEKRKKLLDKKTKEKNTLTEEELALFKELNDLTKYLHDPNRTVEKIREHIDSINHSFNLILMTNEIVRLPVKINEKLRTFLRKCQKNKISIEAAENLFRSRRLDEAQFEKTFNMTYKDADREIRDDLEDLKNVIGLIRSVYTHMIDERNFELGNKQKISKNKCSAIYDPDVSEIIMGNPFNFTTTEFIIEVHKIFDEAREYNIMSVRQYFYEEYDKKFFEMYQGGKD